MKLVVIFLTVDVSYFSCHFNLCVQIFTLLDFFQSLLSLFVCDSSVNFGNN